MENIEKSAPTFTRGQRLKIKLSTANFWKKVVINILLYLLMIGLSYVVLYPLIMRIANSFKSFEDIYNANVYIIPANPTTQYFLENWKRVGLFRSTGLFCLWYSALVAFLQVVSATLVGYGFARFKFPGAKLLFGCVLLVLIVPPTAITGSIYDFCLDFDPFGLATAAGKVDGWNLCATVLPQSVMALTCVGYKNGLYVYLMRQFFKGMPGVLEEAAYIDGAKPFRAFISVMLPSALTMMVTIFLFGFCWQWTDNVYSTTVTIDLPNVMTNAANYNLGSGNEVWNDIQQQSGALIAVLPLILIFIVCQKFFVEGIERSGITGT